MLKVPTIPDNTFAIQVLQLPDSIKPLSVLNGIEPDGVSHTTGTFPIYNFIDNGTLSVSSGQALSDGFGYNGTFFYPSVN